MALLTVASSNRVTGLRFDVWLQAASSAFMVSG